MTERPRARSFLNCPHCTCLEVPVHVMLFVVDVDEMGRAVKPDLLGRQGFTAFWNEPGIVGRRELRPDRPGGPSKWYVRQCGHRGQRFFADATKHAKAVERRAPDDGPAWTTIVETSPSP